MVCMALQHGKVDLTLIANLNKTLTINLLSTVRINFSVRLTNQIIQNFYNL